MPAPHAGDNLPGVGTGQVEGEVPNVEEDLSLHGIPDVDDVFVIEEAE